MSGHSCKLNILEAEAGGLLPGLCKEHQAREAKQDPVSNDHHNNNNKKSHWIVQVKEGKSHLYMFTEKQNK